MAMNAPDQAEAGGGWRMELREMRTRAALRQASPPEDELRRLSDRALRAAIHNPDHSDAGRAAAEAELRARSASAERWRIVVPGFIKPKDLARRGQKLFFGWGRAVRMWSGWGVYLCLLAILALVVSTELGVLSEAQAESISINIGMGVLGLLIVWLVSSALRRHPARVLLLRKFNERHLAEPLERMIAHELRPYGHTASLSDKYIRRDYFGWVQMALLSLSNPLAAAWFVIGLPIRFVWRLVDRSAMGPAVVMSARDYRNLARRLRDRIGLNLQVALVSKEAFLVRTSDAWWRMVVKLLFDSADVIVVDLSQVAEGTAWELDLLRAENALPRCVFVSLWGKLDEAEAALAARGIAAPVFHYAPDGEIQRRTPFRSAMLGAMCATHAVEASR